MSKFIVLYNYNKYYNRIIKKLNTYEEYKSLITPLGSTPAQYRGFELTGTNFSIEDGVFAKHVINTATMASFFQIEQPDYLVLEQEYEEGEETVKRISRWFVLETTKTLGGQFELSLRRDLLADYFNEVVNAPVFIQRGNPGINDPAIFNRESFTYNQIKKGEMLLTNTKLSGKGGGWIVGYLKQADEAYSITNAVGQAEIPVDVPDFEDLPAELQDFIESGEAYYSNPDEFDIGFNYVFTDSVPDPQHGNFDKTYMGFIVNQNNEDFFVPNETYFPGLNLGYVRFKNTASVNWINESTRRDYVIQKWRNYLGWNKFLPKVNAWYNSLSLANRTTTNYKESSYNGMIFRRDGKYYKLTINSQGYGYQKANYTRSQVVTSYNDLCSQFLLFCADQDNGLINGTSVITNITSASDSWALQIRKRELKLAITIAEAEFDEVKATVPATRNQNFQAPYDLFCIPMKNVSVKSSGTTLLTTIENVALAIARGISVKGSSNVLDIQILPYCPFEEILDNNGDVDITGFTENKDYSYITKKIGDAVINCGIILYPKTCRGTFDFSISSNSPLYNECTEEVESAVEKKVKAETKLVRFVSPNFASNFDINVQKNKGIVSLNCDYFYKPYNPYIHIAPYFSGLYGQDYNDPKGLILSGDFSIATAQSQWENYQIQNKNYELIFNRQIQNLDVNNSIAYEQQKIASGIGVATAGLTGVAAGAVAGSMALPGIGTAVGAIAGGLGSAVSSGIGRKYDLEYLKKSQTEARSFAQDMYAYSLGNIQALPYTLTRVSAFTENNKIFPFIEFYDATDEEKEALRNKIKYNGMTVMRIGRISDFLLNDNRYVQGQLIRLEGINEDSHVIAEIANEIKEGAYYYGYDSIGS